MWLLLAALIFLADESAAQNSGNLLSPRPRILITAFAPYPGSPSNGSLQVAQRIKTELGIRGIEVEICVVPVSYQGTVPAARECLQRMNPRPDQVLALGELSSCDTKIETLARNLDNDRTPDADGVRRAMTPIDPQGAERVAFDNHVLSMYCALSPAERQSLQVSHDAGGFICNHLSYVFGQEVQGQGIPFSFAHVPHHRCEREVNRAGQQFSRMIAPTVTSPEALRNQSLVSELNLCQRVPATVEQANHVLQTIEGQRQNNHRACEESFLRQLRDSLNSDVTFPSPSPSRDQKPKGQ